MKVFALDFYSAYGSVLILNHDYFKKNYLFSLEIDYLTNNK